MKKAHKIATAVTAATLFVGISAANAASMADYEKAKAAAMAEVKKVEAEGIAPWNPKAKKPILEHSDQLAEKGDFDGAIKYANYIASLQPIAVKEWKSQPNPGPYKPSR
ncbi:MAG: hypothetical protein B7X29_06245 [Halothiobacillus sp. 13-55-115]|jgi:hypothetical protein|nr:MAG: hypothetical protein B7X29_06245 [Halothiobacillus sp. 13-55-115]